jgi:hypothetical protein
MTNGENTAIVPIREYLTSRGYPGYVGYQSDSEVFTHILHFAHKQLGMGLEMYKHLLTPLKDGNWTATTTAFDSGRSSTPAVP